MRKANALLFGAAVAGLGLAARAALVIDVRATSANGGAVLHNPKLVLVQNATPGAVITFDVFGVVTDNNNAVSFDQGILSFEGSFLSTNVGNGSVRGDLLARRAATFLGTGGSNGFVQDLDADTDLDVGSNNNASSVNFFRARSTSAPAHVPGVEALVGTVTMTLTSNTGGFHTQVTHVNFRPRVSSTAASWFENGTQITSSDFSSGPPVVLQNVPEPAALGLLGVTGACALARRGPGRRQKAEGRSWIREIRSACVAPAQGRGEFGHGQSAVSNQTSASPVEPRSTSEIASGSLSMTSRARTQRRPSAWPASSPARP
jgi:hypothetical protein